MIDASVLPVYTSGSSTAYASKNHHLPILQFFSIFPSNLYKLIYCLFLLLFCFSSSYLLSISLSMHNLNVISSPGYTRQQCRVDRKTLRNRRNLVPDPIQDIPREKRAQLGTIKDVISDSQVNSNFPC